METIITLVGGTIFLAVFLIPILILLSVRYILDGIAFTKLTKGTDIKHRWMVWVPLINQPGRIYLSGHRRTNVEMEMFSGTVIFKNRIAPLVLYIIAFVLSMLIKDLGWIIVAIPVLGTVNLILETVVLIPTLVWLYLIEYIYLRDLLHTLRPGYEKNNANAVWVTILGAFTFGIVRAAFTLHVARKTAAAKAAASEEANVAAEDAPAEADEETPTA